MANIVAGTTGVATLEFTTSYDDCMNCHGAGTFGFGVESDPAPGWSASYDDETVTVPLEAAPGDYVISVRAGATINNLCGGGSSAPCKHLALTVVAANATIEGCGPCVPTPSGGLERECSCNPNQCPPCPQSTGNNTVAGGGGNPQEHAYYGK